MKIIRCPLLVKLNSEDIKRIDKLSEEQSQKYGHDRGYFTLGRDESSHRIGFIGEIGLLRFFKQNYQLREPDDIGQEVMGGKYDLYIFINKIKYYLHVKTGRWKNWPTDKMTFGIHAGQNIGQSDYPLILVSFLKDNESVIKIEGFMTSEEIAKCRLIKEGELFPGSSYRSRTDNCLTYFGQYNDINKIIGYLKNK